MEERLVNRLRGLFLSSLLLALVAIALVTSINSTIGTALDFAPTALVAPPSGSRPTNGSMLYDQ